MQNNKGTYKKHMQIAKKAEKMLLGPLPGLLLRAVQLGSTHHTTSPPMHGSGKLSLSLPAAQQ